MYLNGNIIITLFCYLSSNLVLSFFNCFKKQKNEDDGCELEILNDKGKTLHKNEFYLEDRNDLFKNMITDIDENKMLEFKDLLKKIDDEVKLLESEPLKDNILLNMFKTFVDENNKPEDKRNKYEDKYIDVEDKYIDVENELNTIWNDLNQFEYDLNRVEDRHIDFVKELKDLEKKLNELESKFNELGSEINEYGSKINEVRSRINEYGNKINEVGSEINEVENKFDRIFGFRPHIKKNDLSKSESILDMIIKNEYFKKCINTLVCFIKICDLNFFAKLNNEVDISKLSLINCLCKLYFDENGEKYYKQSMLKNYNHIRDFINRMFIFYLKKYIDNTQYDTTLFIKWFKFKFDNFLTNLEDYDNINIIPGMEIRLLITFKKERTEYWIEFEKVEVDSIFMKIIKTINKIMKKSDSDSDKLEIFNCPNILFIKPYIWELIKNFIKNKDCTVYLTYENNIIEYKVQYFLYEIWDRMTFCQHTYKNCTEIDGNNGLTLLLKDKQKINFNSINYFLIEKKPKNLKK